MCEGQWPTEGAVENPPPKFKLNLIVKTVKNC